ncbi:MAG: class II glutamine amidotransferase [Bacteroidales bacterium]
MALLKKFKKRNPDGFGLCTPTINFKGLDYDKFIKVVKTISENEQVLIHLRYATAGSIRDSNCHPFLDKATNTYFMHNGVLNYTPKDDITDSEYAFREYIIPLLIYGINSKEIDICINHIIGASRFALMQNNDVKLFGTWYEYHGLMLSNMRF